MAYLHTRAFEYAIPDDPTKTLVRDGEAFEAMLRRLQDAPVLGVDYETSGIAWYKHARACGVGLGTFGDDGRPVAYYVPYRHRSGRQLDIERIRPGLKALLARPQALKVAHYIKFDDHIGRRDDLHIVGRRYCTATAARLHNENDQAGLKHRAVTDLGEKDAATWEQHIRYHVTRLCKSYGLGLEKYRDMMGYSEIPIDVCGVYACFDIEYCLRLYALYEHGSDGISARYGRVTATEMRLTEVLCNMEETGMGVDVDYLEQLRDTLAGKLDSLEQQVWAAFPHAKAFSLSNDNQLRSFLLNDLRLPLFERTRSGEQLSVARKVLEHFAEDIPDLQIISNWRDAQKIATTYTSSILGKLDSCDVLHCEFNQMGTNTGRLSSSNPNMQNIVGDSDVRALAHSGKKVEDGGVDPWSIKRAFSIRKGYVRIYMDYSQIELRVLTYYTKDPILTDSYLKDEDVHTRTSVEVFGSADKGYRRIAKVINFGLVYGLSAKGLSRQIRSTEAEAQEYMRRYFARYTGVPAFRDHFWRTIRRRGGSFHNLWGRPRRVPEITSAVPFDRGRAERRAFGSLIQGTAAELTKESLVRIADWIAATGSEAQLVNTIHDEIAVDLPPALLPEFAPVMQYMMVDYPEFAPIPIRVEGKLSTSNWAETVPLPLAH